MIDPRNFTLITQQPGSSEAVLGTRVTSVSNSRITFPIQLPHFFVQDTHGCDAWNWPRRAFRAENRLQFRSKSSREIAIE